MAYLVKQGARTDYNYKECGYPRSSILKECDLWKI